MEAAIRVSDLSVQAGAFVALENVSATITKSKITGLLGPSGAGKTTLIRCMVGLQGIRNGTITILGLPAGSAKLRGRFGYMTQSNSIYRDLTVRENLSYFSKMLLPRKDTRSAVSEVLSLVSLGDKAGQVVESLSGGQRQRVSLAVCLLGRPELLFLDEPTVGLDPVLRRELWSLFRHLAGEGTTIVLSSHTMDEADRCDDLILLRDGHVIADGSPAALRKQTDTKTVEDSFIKLVGSRS